MDLSNALPRTSLTSGSKLLNFCITSSAAFLAALFDLFILRYVC
nr:MAG TPA: hypothetical protein [Caudoviricetes sp.]